MILQSNLSSTTVF